MSKIWKYPIAVKHREMFMMPKGAIVRSFKMQGQLPMLFVEVDPNAAPEPRIFRCVTTGEQFNSEGLEYVGTEMGNEWFTIHLYEVTGKEPDPIDERWKGDYKDYQNELFGSAE